MENQTPMTTKIADKPDIQMLMKRVPIIFNNFISLRNRDPN